MSTFKNLIDGLRSIAFNIAFFGSTIILLVCSVPALFMSIKIQRAVSLLWFDTVYWCEKYVMGLDYRVIGREHLPNGPVIIASKHQSAWETMKVYKIFGDRTGIIAKRELENIPIWGRYGKVMGLVFIDRSKGKDAMKMMVQNAQDAIDNGRSVLLFPQGTRVKVGDQKPYKFGVMKLYDGLNVPLVPVALNAGLFWPKNSFWKKSGTVTVEILPPIAPSLPSDEVFATLVDRIETATNRLCAQPVTS